MVVALVVCLIDNPLQLSLVSNGWTNEAASAGTHLSGGLWCGPRILLVPAAF